MPVGASQVLSGDFHQNGADTWKYWTLFVRALKKLFTYSVLLVLEILGLLLVFTEDIGLVGDGHVTWSQSPSNTDKQEAGFPYHPFHNSERYFIASYPEQDSGMIFLLDPLQGSSLQVEILSISLSLSLSICLSVITSNSFPYLDSKLTQLPPVDLGHTTSPMVSNVPHPCLPCPPFNWSPFPVNWSPNEQDHLADLF